MTSRNRTKNRSLLRSGIAAGLAMSTLAGIMAYIPKEDPVIPLSKGAHIMLIGNNLGSRMMNADHFETSLHLRYPDSNLYVRNMCDGGNTAGFRPHSGRNTPWAFPGRKNFRPSWPNRPVWKDSWNIPTNG
jgi:hypothetical protein